MVTKKDIFMVSTAKKLIVYSFKSVPTNKNELLRSK